MELTDVWLLFLRASAYENCIGTVSTEVMLCFILRVIKKVLVPKLRPELG